MFCSLGVEGPIVEYDAGEDLMDLVQKFYTERPGVGVVIFRPKQPEIKFLEDVFNNDQNTIVETSEHRILPVKIQEESVWGVKRPALPATSSVITLKDFREG